MPSEMPAIVCSVRDRAVRRILAEIESGLEHGYFQYSLTCEVIGKGRRRLVLSAGKTHQFVIPPEECESTDLSSDLRHEGAVDAQS